MKPLFPCFAFIHLLFSTITHAQLEFKWGASIGSDKSDLTGRGMIDNDDNYYIVSSFFDTTDLDPGPGTYLLLPKAASNFVLTKFDAHGQFLLSARFNGGEGTWASLLEVKNNEIKVMVRFRDSLFYELEGVKKFELEKAGLHICFLSLTLEAEVLRSYVFPAPAELGISKYQTMPNKQILICGLYLDSLKFAPPSDLSVYAQGNYDAFIALLNPDYTPIWIHSFGSEEQDHANSFSISPEGEIYFAVGHRGELTVDMPLESFLFPVHDERNCFLVRMNLAGELLDLKAFENDDDFELLDLTFDLSGNLYIVGQHEGTTNFAHPSQVPVTYTEHQNGEGFIAKYNKEDMLQWVRVYTNSNHGSISGIQIKRENEIYLTANVNGDFDSDPGPGIVPMQSDGSDFVIIKLDLTGSQLWFYHFEGTSSDGIRSLCVSTQYARIFINGFMYGTIDADPGPGTHHLATNGSADAFMISLTENNVITSSTPVVTTDLFVYPNPTSDKIRFNSEYAIDQITITLMDGRQVHKEPGQETQEFEMDLTNLPSALYLLSIHTGNNIRTARIVKE